MSDKPEAPSTTDAPTTEHTHTFSDWQVVTATSCETDGELARTCSSCGFKESTILQKLGHKFVKTVKAPGCETQGFTKYTCPCGYSYESEHKPSTGHKTTPKIIDPTCTSEGYTENICACGYSFRSDFKAPLPHATVATITAPTCTAEGYTENVCACGYTYRSDYKPTIEHKLTTSGTQPSCTEEGSLTYNCSTCTYSYTIDNIPPTGHTFEETSYLPTAVSAGYTHYVCHCGYSYDGNYIYYSEILEYAYTENTTVIQKGIDVSKWNHRQDAKGNYIPLDWAAIKAAGYDFVILKVGSTPGDGYGGLDPVFEMNYRDAKAAGLEVGAYFYTYATNVEEVLKDAELCMSWLQGKQFEYPIYFDLEDPELVGIGKNLLTDMCVAFICALQENGYYSGLYVNNNWLRNILDEPRVLTLFDIWYARYPLTDIPEWNFEKYGRQLGMWQFTEKGTINGFSCYFDMNFSYKNYKELMIKWGLNGFNKES